MVASTVKTANKADGNSIIGVITMAFGTDPVARWVYPESSQYLTYFPSFIRAFGGRAFESGSVHYVDGFMAAALWLPPNVHPDEDALMALFDETVSEEIKRDLFPVFEEMGKYHPGEPHWYLPMIGADPLQQGKGYGSALLQYALSICDRDGKLAYLESSNPQNIPLYQRHGFELTGTIQVGASPPLFPMLRRPR